MTGLEQFFLRGWIAFPAEAAVLRWVEGARAAARSAVRDPANAHWLRCGGTWFVGVDALPNDGRGRMGDGPPLAGAAMRFIRNDLDLDLPLHRAQVSVCYPGYPKPSASETPSAFQFRVKRDAAHVDGLLAEGPERRRFLKEPHAYILGVSLAGADPAASPLAVWDGSHRLMREAFEAALPAVPASGWAATDITGAYQAARRRVFETCQRIEMPMRPGEAILLHRHLLHGVAPWKEGIAAAEDGRMIAYFRPAFRDAADWLRPP